MLLQATDAAAELPGGYGLALLQALLALGAVCVLAWAVLRWAAQRGLGGASSAQRIKVLERVPLDARRTMWLVEVGGRVLLVGGSDGGSMTLLTEVDADALPPVPPKSSFADVLRRAPSAPKE